MSVNGVQPEKGNETVYLVRDALTDCVLCAENVTASETAVMKTLLAPVAALRVLTNPSFSVFVSTRFAGMNTYRPYRDRRHYALFRVH